MTNKFKLGTNFDLRLIDEIAKENAKHKTNHVTEIYGSIREHAALAARPDFRLPDVSELDLCKYIDRASNAGLQFNYTLNSINPYGSKSELLAHESDVKALVKWLHDAGVWRVTVANPMLLEMICDIDVKNRPLIEMSTVAHIDCVTQIKYFFEKHGISKICANLNKNRDFAWLKAAAKYCNNHNIELELMANEFCGVGGSNYATHCVYRDSCYICHSTNVTKEDAESFNNYPMRLCTLGRNENPSNWLKSKFIRPEDIHYYREIGVTSFKLTGRTGSTDLLMKVCRAYLNENFDGNLLELWKPLESITQHKDESFTHYNIPNKALDGFIDKFVTGHNCDNEVCGDTCRYCNNFFERHAKEENV